MHLLRYPVTLGKFPRRKDLVQVTYGMYGPYIHQGRTNVPLRDKDPDAVTLEQAIEMVRDKEANPKPAYRRGRRQKATVQDAKATDASAGSEPTASDDKPVTASAGHKAPAKPRKGTARRAGKAKGKVAGGVKAGKTKAKPAAKKTSSKATKKSPAGSKSAWSSFLAAHIPELKKQQPDITFGDVCPFFATCKAQASITSTRSQSAFSEMTSTMTSMQLRNIPSSISSLFVILWECQPVTAPKVAASE